MKPKYRPPVRIYNGPGEAQATRLACPYCGRRTSLTPRGTRRAHRDAHGTCPGSGVLVSPRLIDIDKDKIRAAAGEVGQIRLDPLRTPAEIDSTTRRQTAPRCEQCGQNPRERGDGRLEAHRITPHIGPYCPGGAPKGRS
jgi:hypothetical protein